MKIAVIPARGGSKRIPRKNMKIFHGRPMIAWSIDAAKSSNCFDHIIVSTDDEEIAEIAVREGAEVPFIRPPELADDNTATVPVIRHAVEWVAENWAPPEAACCLYATAPFVQPQKLQEGMKKLEMEKAAYCLSVTSFPFPIQRGMRILSNGRVEMFQPEHVATRSQDLEESYHDAGQFYWGASESWLNEIPLISPESVSVYLPRHLVQDIDTPEDWMRAELLFELLQKQSN